MIGRITTRQPASDAGARLTEKRESRLRGVQAARPAAERGGIRHTIRVPERRRGLFPGAMFHKTPPQCLTARPQTVVRVRERKARQEGEGLPTTGATAAPDVNPVVMLIMRLLAAASMADDRIAFTNRASPQDDFRLARGPLRFELVRRGRKWDKRNRSLLELPGIHLPRSRPEAELLPPEGKIQLEESTASRL